MQERPLTAPGESALGLVLLGVSGCGKTTIGRGLAPRLGATFLEGDDFHPSSNIAKMRSGTPLDDADRWPWLKTIGHAIGDHLAQGRSVVAACSALRRAYRDALNDAARHPLIFVHLTMERAVLDARIRARRQHFMPVSLLESQLATLEPLGDDERGTEVPASGTAQQTIDAIERWLDLRCKGHLGTGRKKERQSRPFAREHRWLDWSPDPDDPEAS